MSPALSLFIYHPTINPTDFNHLHHIASSSGQNSADEEDEKEETNFVFNLRSQQASILSLA